VRRFLYLEGEGCTGFFRQTVLLGPKIQGLRRVCI
jgi:hypothetical protein